MYDMFNGTKSLTNLDVSNFDMSHVVDMWGMFSNMYRLQSITGISNLDVSNVNNMCDLFFNDMSLQSLDLSSWNAKLTKAGAITRGATTGEGTSGMFANTISLKNLDISGIDNTDDSSQANMFLMDPGMADSSTSPFAANQYTSHLTHLVLGSKFVMTSDNDLDATMPKATWNRYDSNGKLVVLSGSEINNGQANPGDWQVGQSYQFFDSVTKQQIGGNYIIQGIPGSTVTVSIPAGYQLVGSTLYQLDGTTKQGTTDQFALDQTLNPAQPVAFYLVKIDPVTVTFVDHGRVVSSAQETTVEGQVVNLHDQIPAGYQVVDPTQLVFRAGGQDINQTIEVEINGDHQPSSTTSGTASGSPSTGSAAASSASPIVKRVDLFDNRDNGSLPHTAARVIKSSFSMLFSFEAIGVTTVAVAGFFKKNRH
ncbi:bacterial surface protein 26-residue [Fructobacillus pseudoficulneus]|uniref:Bacterial surface protein 26-residue n=1 Tax=Fructobacillus pseudoficulneus TaxID=220714 RepID=A0A3F3GWX1_9LACO|nr:BspA family leucine-rich repeat surface protein [Fructobacillus pseudoficulneus]GAP02672.1 bacterial surface protein 26-residue [Fructobacillus pseudoficulneus]SEH38978.1 surface protein [Fructobacillus pseudoficulneus]